MKKILFFAVVFASVFSCSGQDSQLKQQCAQQDSTTSPVFLFKGFTYSEVKNTLVKDLRNSIVVDSFYIDTEEELGDSLDYDGDFGLGRHIKVSDTYQFNIPGYPPYILSNMKMVYKRVYKGYLSRIGQYDLNGVTYYNANPEFIKDSASIGN